MATCKDCIHYDVCTFNLTGHENKNCTHFLNKADVVKVVECHECKYWKDIECICLFHSVEDGRVLMCPTGFCSYGERKEQE